MRRRCASAVQAVLSDEPGALVIPTPTTAEIDYMLGVRLGAPARRAFLADLAAARFTVAGLEREDYARIINLEAGYANLGLGLADSALVVLAARHRTTWILSFDERHFCRIAPGIASEAESWRSVPTAESARGLQRYRSSRCICI